MGWIFFSLTPNISFSVRKTCLKCRMCIVVTRKYHRLYDSVVVMWKYHTLYDSVMVTWKYHRLYDSVVVTRKYHRFTTGCMTPAVLWRMYDTPHKALPVVDRQFYMVHDNISSYLRHHSWGQRDLLNQYRSQWCPRQYPCPPLTMMGNLPGSPLHLYIPCSQSTIDQCPLRTGPLPLHPAKWMLGHYNTRTTTVITTGADLRASLWLNIQFILSY